MSSKLDYLSKYTSSGEGDKKKKKKKKKKSKSRSYEHEIHDEADFDAYNSDQSNHLDEDAPVVVNEVLDDIAVNAKNLLPWKDVEEERNESKGRKSRKYDSDDEGSDHRMKRKRKSRRYDSDDDDDDRGSEKSESRRRYDSDDLSENKRKRKSGRYDSDDERRSNNHDPSDDGLPNNGKKSSKRKSRRYDSDDEQEVRRKSKSRRRYDSDDDNRRKSRYDSDEDASERKPKARRKRYDSDDSSNEGKPNDRAKMSSGHSAGLQSTGAFKEAEEKLQRKKHTNVENLERGETVYRNKDGGAVPISSTEKKYDDKESDPSWNLGTIQKRQMMQNNYEIEAIREGTFARSVDDVDKYKKDIARDGDPMMKYQTNTNKKVYKGPPPKPNRFGIMPGYRWDGIDRGNGFEEKVLASLYAKGRKEEERYKWSCADM